MAGGPPGIFITFEGGEGAGKSTQVARIAAWLEASGRQTVVTREPGGSPGAEEIRQLLVSGAVDRWDPVCELLLHAAARRDHVERTVRPALARGAWVLCDRFTDSTRAYQGFAHGVPQAAIEAVREVAVGSLMPDLTIVLDLPPEAGLARVRAGHEDRYERMEMGFHRRLREGFLAIAREEPDRCVVVDASRSADDVAATVRSHLDRRFGPAA